MENRDGRTASSWGNRISLSLVLFGLVASLAVFQNCSKKGTSSNGSNDPQGGYAPKQFNTQGFGFGDRAPASVQYLRSSNRVVATGLSNNGGESIITGTFEAGGDKDVAFVRVGSDGLIQSAYTVGGDGQEEVHAQGVTDGGQVLAVGSVLKNAGSGFEKSGLIAVADENGLGMRAYSAGALTSFSAISSSSDSFVAGFSSAATRGGTKVPLLARIDGNQNVVWSRKLSNIESGEFLAVTVSGNQLIAAGYSGKTALIARYNSDGRFLGAADVSLGGTSQILAADGTGDGGVVVAGSYRGTGNERGFVAKLNSSNRVVWARLTGIAGKLQAVKALDNGEIVATGSAESSTRSVSVIRLTSAGRVMSQSALGSGVGSFFSGKALTIDSQGEARVAYNSTIAGGTYNPVALARLGEASAADCGLIAAGNYGLSGTSARSSSSAAKSADGGLKRVNHDGRSAAMNLSTEDQCF